MAHARHGAEGDGGAISTHGARCAWWLYFTLGIGILAPWNAFIAAADYFSGVFPGRHMDRAFTLAYLPTCLLLLLIMLRWDNAYARARLVAAYTGFAVLMLAVPMVRAALRASGC